MMERMMKAAAALIGMVISFFSDIPPYIWVLIAVMTLDYISGLLCGAAGVSTKTEGGGLSSTAAFRGLVKKCEVMVLVLLAVLLDSTIAMEIGANFSAVTGAVCAWFIASEGVSILENAAELGLPIPGVLKQALEIMKGVGEEGAQEK